MISSLGLDGITFYLASMLLAVGLLPILVIVIKRVCVILTYAHSLGGQDSVFPFYSYASIVVLRWYILGCSTGVPTQ